eukprot:6631784-Prymnesium_polylepis.1
MVVCRFPSGGRVGGFPVPYSVRFPNVILSGWTSGTTRGDGPGSTTSRTARRCVPACRTTNCWTSCGRPT